MAGGAERVRKVFESLKRPSTLLILGVNLVPAVCALLFGWDVGILILLYWAENVLVGLFHAPRILAVGLSQGRSGLYTSLFLTPFFIVHYGLFCLGHGIFALLFIALDRARRSTDEAFTTMMTDLPGFLMAQPGFGLSLAVIAGLQAFELIRWLLGRGWRGQDGSTLMIAPYGRIVALHITLIGTAAILVMLGSPAVGILLLAVLKTVFEEALARGRRMTEPAASGSGS